jgi:adenosylhomocysteine nucleosidase
VVSGARLRDVGQTSGHGERVSRVAIIAAMEREILPLVEGWSRVPLTRDNEKFSCFEKGELVAVAGGIGCKRAERAARAVVEKYRPQTLLSAGLAGALIRSLKIGNIVVPGVIVDAESGAEYRCDGGDDIVSGGVLVSTPEIASSESKPALVERFHALVVDMEAAGVARVARELGLKLRCVKAISDEFNFRMPPLGRFIDAEGDMRASKFALWVAIRPQHWASTIQLARNSRRATQSLNNWLRKNLGSSLAAPPVVTLDTADHLKT